MIFPAFTNLITERLLLRQLHVRDAEQIFKIRSDARVNQFVERTAATSLNDGRAFIKKIQTAQKKREAIMWAISIKGEPKLIGTVLYWHLDQLKDEAEIGYEMLPEYFGRGIMREAVLKVIQFGLQTLKLKTILAVTKTDNLRSVNLLEKCNFVPAGETNDDYLIFSLSAGENQL